LIERDRGATRFMLTEQARNALKLLAFADEVIE
jgi:hypothetical protein